MPGNPRSILKKPKASFSHGMSKNEAGPSTLHRNTKLNAGSKLQKTVQQNNRRSADRRPRKHAEEEDEEEEEEESDGFGGGDEEDVEMSEVDTDEEIARIKSGDGKEKKERKRKRPATTAETFGSTLTALLSEPAKKPKRSTQSAAGAVDDAAAAEDDKMATEKQSKQTNQPAPSSTILSLSHARAPPSRSAENLERKAKRHLQALKEEKEDKARIRDVVEGWAARSVDGGATVVGGQEFEKGLRKTAQRGVIKLFNAILVASKTAEEATTSLSAKAGVKDEKPKGKKEKDNIMGRGGKAAPLTQESFLDLVRKG